MVFDQLSTLLTGYSSSVNEKVEQFKSKGIRVFQKECEISGILIKASDPLAKNRLLTGLPERGLLVKHGGQSCIVLYNRRAVNNAPEIFNSWQKVPDDYVSKTTLKKQGFKDDQIRQLKRVAFVYGKYRETCLYSMNDAKRFFNS